MSISNIVLNDGESTPVAHTFTPAGQNGMLTTWHEVNSDLHQGSNVLTASISDPNKSRVADQVRVKLVLNEVVEDLDTGVFSVDYFSTVDVKATISRKASTQHGKNLRTLIANAVADAVIAKYFDTRTPEL